MKTLITSFVILLTVLQIFSQNITLTQEDLNKLSESQREAIVTLSKTNEVKDNIETYSKYAGMGKEIGIGANEALKAISSTAVDLSEKKLGKWIMILVTWKVMGTDLLQIVITPIWVLFVTILSVALYRSNLTKRVLISKSFNKEVKGWEYKYEIINNDKDKFGDTLGFKTAAIVLLVCGYIIAIPLLFA